jgi:maltoporin
LTAQERISFDAGVKNPWIQAGGWLLGSAVLAVAQEDTAAALRQELDAIRSDYQKRIDQLEQRVRELESRKPEAAPAPRQATQRKVPDPPTAPAPAPEAAARTGRAARMAVDERFRNDTETRDIARQPDARALLDERIEDVLEGYIDITGYFRAGYGRSSQGGPQRAFGIPDFAKYRLGNETNNYGELAFSKTFYPAGVFANSGIDEHDPVARMVYRMSFENPYDDYGTASNTDFGSPEIWGSLSNVVPGHSDAKIWAGNRFYRRHDIHINDFYFWDMSGGGGGIEDLNAGPGKFAFAWIGDGAQSSIYSNIGLNDPLNEAGFSKSNFDLRYYDWAFLGGTGEVGLVYAAADSGVDSTGRKAEDSDGIALSFVQTHQAFLDENSLHKLSLQFGTGPAKTFNSGFETFTNSDGTFIRPDPNESWRFRFTDQIVVKPLDQLSVGGAAVYQYTDFGDNAPDQHWISGGVRPVWHFNEVFSLAFEGGVDWASETSSGPGGTLGKLTLAPQVSLGDEFFSRPVLRAFVTYGLWANGLKGEVGGPEYADKTSGWSWGLQMESWW